MAIGIKGFSQEYQPKSELNNITEVWTHYIVAVQYVSHYVTETPLNIWLIWYCEMEGSN